MDTRSNSKGYRTDLSEELWKYAAKGNAYNLGGYIPPDAYGHNPDLELFTYDTERARELLAEAGCPDGFEVNLITSTAWELETQIMSKMLERIGLNVSFEVFTFPEFMKRVYIPILEEPPEDQNWDIAILFLGDWYGNSGASFLTWNFIDESELRWIKYDPTYKNMWEDMVRTVDRENQEEKIHRMVKYVYDNAYCLFIYSPIALYAVNKEVRYVTTKDQVLRFKKATVTDSHWSIKGEEK